MTNQRDLTLATVNLYNLQKPGAAMYPTSRPYSEEEYEDKIDWTAGTLIGLNADIIAFQELWSRDCLGDAFEAAGLDDEYDLVFITDGDWDGIAVAAAVRKPWKVEGWKRHKAFPDGFKLKKRKRRMAEIQDNPSEADRDTDLDGVVVESHEDEEIEVGISEFSRSVLQVTVGHERADDVPPIEVFCSHLKSKRPSPLDIEEYRDDAFRPHRNALGGAISTIRRTAEAAALRIILNETLENTDVPAIVLGDLNDSPLSNTLAILTDQPSYRLYAGSRAASRNDKGLFAAAFLQQLRSLRDTLYSHEFKGVRELIDHVLVSEQFYDHSDRRHWSFRELHVWNDHVEDDEKATSDHGVVTARFDWNPAG